MNTVIRFIGKSALALAVAAAHSAYAEVPAGKTQPAVKTKKAQIEETLVWATQVKASSVKLSEERIAIMQADHISDLLRTIPGVDVGGAHSLNQRITIRSMDDKDLRITIDGANQNTYMYHHMGNLQIHADILQSVDVEIGTNSVVNGGLGGAVRFETKSAEQLLRDGRQFGARIQGSYADNASDGWSLTGYGKFTDSLDFLVYHNTVNRDNYEVGGGEIKDENGDEVPGTDGEVRGLEGEVEDTLLKLGWDIADNQRLEIGYEMYIDEGDYSYRPDMGLATDLAIVDALDAPLLWPTEFTRDTLTINYDAQIDSTLLKVTLFDNRSTLERDETGYSSSSAIVLGTPVADWAATVTGDADNSGLNILAETGLGMHTLTYGAEYIDYETSYRASYLIGSVDRSSEQATTTSLFLQDRIQLTEALAIIPGVRYDDAELDAVLVDDSFDEITGALAAEYAITPALLIKLSSTQLFKAPEIGEVFTGAGLFDVANPDIDAETGFNHEFAVAYEEAVLGADRFATGITIFQTDIEDYIYDYAPAPAATGARRWKDNIGDMNLKGFEAYVGYDIGGLSVLLTYSEAESDLDAFDDYADLDGARIDRQQGDTVSLSVDYVIESLDLQLHWDVLDVDDVGAGLDLDGATLDNAKDGYTVHNISARWTPSAVEGLAVTAGVDNVTDEFYASQSSRTGTSFHPLFGNLYLVDYEPGRNYKMTVSYAF